LKRHRGFKQERGQALMEYLVLVLFVVGVAVVIMNLIVPFFRIMFMQKLMNAVVRPFM
jgi:uncharacterized protein (UPF0333 family)